MQPQFTHTDFERFVLGNGLEVLLCRDASLPVVTSMLWYKVGSVCETPGNTGVSHFLEHMLFKGSRSFGKGEIDRLTLLCGGANNAFTWLDATTYYFSLPANHWELALKVEADRMQGALLDPTEIESERQVILEEWQSAQDDPDELFWDNLNSLALQRHAYRYPVLGWSEDIHGLNREKLESHYRRYYHPNLATLVLVGDLPEDALSVIESYLGQIPAGEVPVTPEWQEPPANCERRFWMPREDVQLPRLAVCWPAPALSDPDYPALVLLHYLLTEGWSSRLHQSLVEDQHLASDVSSLLFETRSPYLFWIQLDLPEIKPREAVEAALFSELEKIQTDGVTEAEYRRLRNQLLTDYHLGQETTEDRAEFAGEMATAGGWELLCDYQDRLEAVTREDIQRVAQRWLQPEVRTIGWLWPSATADGDEESEESETGVSAKTAGPHRDHHEPPAPRDGFRDFPAFSSAPRELEMPNLDRSRTEFENGLVTLVHPHAKTPTFSLDCWLPAGSRFDPDDQGGLANLTLSALIKGTQQRSAREYSEALEELGANLSINASYAGASLSVEALSEHFEPVLELLAEALQQPALSSEEIAKEKRLILSDLQLALESSSYQSSMEFIKRVYSGSGLGLPVDGLPESLTDLGPAQVKDFYNQTYGPAGSVLAVSGALDADLATRCIQTHFGKWSAQTQPVPEMTQLKRQNNFQYQHIALPNRDQCVVLLGHLGIERRDPDFVPLLMLDVILGNGPGFASRIPRHLRDELGLAYYVSYASTIGAQVWPGLVQGQIETSPEKALGALKALLGEVRAVQQDGVSEAELAAAQAYLSGRFVFLFETNAQRTGYLLQRELYGWPEDFLNTYLERIRSVTREEILAAAQRHLDTHNYTLITAGPRPHWNEESLHEL